MTDILLGTCGWSYAEWEGILYPQKQAKLKQYSSIFPTTEIDSTFYSLPKQEIVLGWARHTPSNFIFSAKLPQTVTHKKALDVARGIEADLNQFIETMKPLIDAVQSRSSFIKSHTQNAEGRAIVERIWA